MKQELVETDFEDDDLEDAITSADDAELCPTPVSPTDAFLKVQIRESIVTNQSCEAVQSI
jgi:hypothetical protein